MVRVLCALGAVLLLSGCLSNATVERLLAHLEDLNETLETELANVRKELGKTKDTETGPDDTEQEGGLALVDPAGVGELTGTTLWTTTGALSEMDAMRIGEFRERAAKTPGLSDQDPPVLFLSSSVVSPSSGTVYQTLCYFSGGCRLKNTNTFGKAFTARNAYPGLGYENKSGNLEPIGERHGVILARDYETIDGGIRPGSGNYDLGIFNYFGGQGGPAVVTQAEYTTYGGWLNYSTFDVGIMGVYQKVPHGEDTRSMTSVGISYGFRSMASPTASATWRGVMVGSIGDSLAPYLGRFHQIQGDAEIRYILGLNAVNVAFTNIHDLVRKKEVPDLRWYNLQVKDGAFSSRFFVPSQYMRSDGISGSFYGPNHEEVGGVFHEARRNVLGAFGAERE